MQPTYRFVLGIAGSGAGAGCQLFLLFLYKQSLSATDFSALLMAMAIAVSVSTIALFNQHVEALSGSIDVPRLFAKVYFRIFALSVIVYGFYEGYLASTLPMRSQILVIVGFVFAYAFFTATTQLYLAVSIQQNNKRVELISRSGLQLCLLSAMLIARPSDLSTVIYISVAVGIAFCTWLHLHIKPSLNSGNELVRVSNTNIDPRERLLFALNVVTDGLTVPLTFVGWAVLMPPAMNADVLFVFRLLNGGAGVMAAGLSMHLAKFVVGLEVTHVKLFKYVAAIGIAPLIGVTGLFIFSLIVSQNFLGISDAMMVYCAIAAWQLIIGIVGSLAMIPKLYKRQTEFSVRSVIYNLVLVLAANYIALVVPQDLSIERQLTLGILSASLLMGVTLLWLVKLISQAIQSSQTKYV